MGISYYDKFIHKREFCYLGCHAIKHPKLTIHRGLTERSVSTINSHSAVESRAIYYKRLKHKSPQDIAKTSKTSIIKDPQKNKFQATRASRERETGPAKVDPK